jgi:hypothetical protein
MLTYWLDPITTFHVDHLWLALDAIHKTVGHLGELL